MSGTVVFDYQAWAARYPELAGSVVHPQAQLFFDEATLYCDNTPCSPITDLGQRAVLLNMVTAHVAALNAPLNGVPSSPLVGRITSATEGSVSVQVSLDARPGAEQWWAQTKYGAAFWRASAMYRLGRYYAAPDFEPDPFVFPRGF